MKRVALVCIASLLALVAAAPAAAASPPSEFGSDYADPQTPDPPVVTPKTTKCSVTIVRHQFKDFVPFTGRYTPPGECRGAWSKVVLRLDGAVKGVQYDRIGYLEVGGVPLFRTSTPEPSADGIRWHVEKDVSDYAPLLRTPHDVLMDLGNLVNDEYTGVLDVTVTLDFYRTGSTEPPLDAPDQVLPLAGVAQDDTDVTGALTVPRNTTRLLAEVYATGSGGGCEEFWDTSAPASTGYSCPDGLPYREVQVLVDGRIAGIALPYPHIYTGGWSNPYLWRPSPAPRSFDVKPLEVDLTPFVGTLTDGEPHDVRLHVVGVPSGGTGWFLLPAFQVWQDHHSTQTSGALTAHAVGEPRITDTVTGSAGAAGSVELHAHHSLTVSGHVRTSHGTVTTTVHRVLANASDHSWTAGETHDQLTASWRDDSVVTTTGGGRPNMRHDTLGYRKDGSLDFVARPTIPEAYDVSGEITLADTGRSTAPALDTRYSNTYRGNAHWIYGVPRDQRHATGEQTTRYHLTGDPAYGCYDHVLAATNGFYTTDKSGC